MDIEPGIAAIGMVGAFGYVLAYFLLQAGYLRGESDAYTYINLAAAVLVLISLWTAFNWASLIIQLSWIAISIVGLVRRYVFDAAISFNVEEREFLDRKLPTLSPRQAREFFRRSLWVNGVPGTELTAQSVQNTSVYYLAEGRAEVIVDDAVVAEIYPHSYIGEITCFSALPATATVRLSAPSRYMRAHVDDVRLLAKRDPVLKRALEESFATDLSRKLQASNMMAQRATKPTSSGGPVESATG